MSNRQTRSATSNLPTTHDHEISGFVPYRVVDIVETMQSSVILSRYSICFARSPGFLTSLFMEWYEEHDSGGECYDTVVGTKNTS